MSDATDSLLATVRAFGDDSLRDVWLFDQWTHERLFVRDDVAERLADVDVKGFVDNERYGYVTRDTYEAIWYSEYRYTVRGFESFEQFRTFLAEDGMRIGFLASFDRCDGGRDWRNLDERIREVTAQYPIGEFVPAEEFVD
jgi:hypothetical protein